MKKKPSHSLFDNENKLSFFLHNFLRHGLFIILGITAISFATFFSQDSCLREHQWCGQDMDQYIDYSNSLLAGHGYSAKAVSNMYFIDPKTNTEYIPEILRLPAYPIILTLGRLLYNDSFLVLIYNFAFYLLIIYYSYKILKLFLPLWMQIIIFALILFNPTLLFYTSRYGNADTFATFALLGFSYHAIRIYLGNQSRLQVLLASLLGILAIMTRQNMLLLIVPVMLLFILSYYKNFINNSIRNALLFVLCTIIFVLGIWIFRNFILTGKPIISALSGQQLFSEHTYFSPAQNGDTKKLIKWFFTDLGGEKDFNVQRKNGKTIPQSMAIVDGHINHIVDEYMIRNVPLTLEHNFRALVSIYTTTTFTWDKKDFISFLKGIEKSVNYFLLFIFPIFPLTYFIKKQKEYFILLSFWFGTFLFIYLSAFYHGMVIGNRGLLPVFVIQLLLCGVFISNLGSKIFISLRKIF